MNIELENNGKKCTKFKINDQDFGEGISELEIKIVGGEKPLIKILLYATHVFKTMSKCDILRGKGQKTFK